MRVPVQRQPAPGDIRVVVGDLHSDLPGLIAMLRQIGALDEQFNRTPGFFLISVGDLLHLGHADHSGDRSTAEFCRELFDIILCGNHELWHAWGIPVGQFEGMHSDLWPETTHIIRSWTHAGQLQPAAAVDGWLITHAGVHREWLETFPARMDAAQLAHAINRRFRGRLTGERLHDPLFDASSPLRSRQARLVAPGGLFWCDRREHLAAEPGRRLPQIYGHTPQDHVNLDEARQHWCVDVGAKLDGRVCALVKRGENGSWEPLEVRVRPSVI